jgi:hypothetical protein
MAKMNEKIHASIVEIMQTLNCSMIEATLEFCEENEVDPEDLIKQLDALTIERLKLDAIQERMVRKSVAGAIPRKLPL